MAMSQEPRKINLKSVLRHCIVNITYYSFTYIDTIINLSKMRSNLFPNFILSKIEKEKLMKGIHFWIS